MRQSKVTVVDMFAAMLTAVAIVTTRLFAITVPGINFTALPWVSHRLFLWWQSAIPRKLLFTEPNHSDEMVR